MWLREFRPLSIRLRLLLLVGLGIGALILALFLLLDHTVDRQIYGYLDDTLRARTHAIAVLLESQPAPEAMAQLQAMSPEYAWGGHTDFLQLWDSDGRTLLASDSNDAASLIRPHHVPANTPLFYDLTLPDGHKGRALAVRVSMRGHAGEAVLVVAEEREQVHALERRVHVALVSGALMTALFAVLVAVWVVRSGLQPLVNFGSAVRRSSEAYVLPVQRLPSELRPLAEVFNDAFGRLRQALQRERRFTRDVAHELRTPLAELRTAIELAQRDAPTSAPLEGALASTDRMTRAVDGLLSLSRYESGMQEVQVEPADLGALLQRTLALAEPVAARRQVRFQRLAPQECWIQTDASLLERILDNLLLNAAAYAPEGSEVKLALQRDSRGVSLRIGNLAPALQPEDLERLGERFWRKSAEREGSRHGGLGLALARSLAELLGLRLEFYLDEGTLWAQLHGLRDLSA